MPRRRSIWVTPFCFSNRDMEFETTGYPSSVDANYRLPSIKPSPEYLSCDICHAIHANMKVAAYPLHPPELKELASVIQKALKKNFKVASVSVEKCPDLRNEPFFLASKGLSGNESVADIGGQPNLFPTPKLDRRYSLLSMAENMRLRKEYGMLIGAGAGPFFDVGVNNELAPNISWNLEGSSMEVKVNNLTHYTRVCDDGSALCQKCPTTNCALMMNLYGSDGIEGPVLKVTASQNTGGQSLTDCIRFGLHDHYGGKTPISIGGAFVMKKGVGKYHVMPGFPPDDQLPFKDPKQLNDWLTWHSFEAPMTCLTVMHTVDPGDKEGKKLGLRMEHTHCFAEHRSDQGGHYHTDIQGDGVDEVQYEGYFNTARTLFRIDQPDITLERDLHD